MTAPLITNRDSAPIEGGDHPAPWAASWRVLTPQMRAAGGTLGMVENTLPPGSVGCPFHWHMHEDEIFYVLRGKGVLRYGDTIREIAPGDCISCPAGTRVAHQLANPFDEPLVYLAVGPHLPDEICGYPDSGKVMVRSLRTVGRLEATEYMDGEPAEPPIFALDRARRLAE